MKKGKKELGAKNQNRVLQSFMPAKMQPSHVYMLNPKTLEKSVDIELLDDDLYSIDSNGEKKISMRSIEKRK